MNWSDWSIRWSVPEHAAEATAKSIRRTLADAFRVDLTYADLMRPGRTGQILLERMGVDLTPLPEDIQLLISSTACQHRIELFPRDTKIDALHRYDGRVMYVGCCRGLGVAGGRYERVMHEDIHPHERGRAKIRFVAPDDWNHIGLFAIQDDEGGWGWPYSGFGETWADLSEIRLARQLGWWVLVEEKIVWPEDRPLDLWSTLLGRLYVRAKEAGNDDLAGCYRAICLHTIGRMHNLGYRTEDVEVSDGDLRATVENVRGVTDTGVVIAQRRATNKPPQHIHPEWSAAIWSRARLRIARAALSLPPDALHAIYGDAIYTSLTGVDGREGWRDDGSVGRLRLNGSWTGPMSAPCTWSDLKKITGEG